MPLSAFSVSGATRVPAAEIDLVGFNAASRRCSTNLPLSAASDFRSSTFSPAENVLASPYSVTPMASRSMSSLRTSREHAATQADSPLSTVTTSPS